MRGDNALDCAGFAFHSFLGSFFGKLLFKGNLSYKPNMSSSLPRPPPSQKEKKLNLQMFESKPSASLLLCITSLAKDKEVRSAGYVSPSFTLNRDNGSCSPRDPEGRESQPSSGPCASVQVKGNIIQWA